MTDHLFHLEVFESGLDACKVASGAFDDDGKPKRTGNVWTASAHIITSIIGSGVLSLAWGVAQLGWVAGVATLVIFAFITLYTSSLLADCYRSPDPVSGRRNYTYTHAVKANLGGKMSAALGIVQYANLCGMVVGYTITASISIVAIKKSNCFHTTGHEASCSFSYNPYMIGMGILEIFLSQIPNFHKLSILSIVAAIMSFAYSSIGVGLAFAKVVSGKGERTTLTGVEIGMGLSPAEKTWRMFSALGDIAFAFCYSQVLIEIQDTLRSSQPENKVMKKANMMAVTTTSIFYMMCGCFGYAAFGNHAKGNLLTGFGFYEPFWLVDLANICIVVHLVGAYQPLFSAFERLRGEYQIGIGEKYKLSFNFLRLTWRSAFVIAATTLAMVFPFFNDILGLVGAISYWPLAVFFPVEVYIAQKRIGRWSCKWLALQLMNAVCFLVALAAACGSIQGLSKSLKEYKPFQVKD